MRTWKPETRGIPAAIIFGMMLRVKEEVVPSAVVSKLMKLITSEISGGLEDIMIPYRSLPMVTLSSEVIAFCSAVNRAMKMIIYKTSDWEYISPSLPDLMKKNYFPMLKTTCCCHKKFTKVIKSFMVFSLTE